MKVCASMLGMVYKGQTLLILERTTKSVKLYSCLMREKQSTMVFKKYTTLLRFP